MEWIKYGSATMLFMVTEPYFYVYEIFVFVILSRKIKKPLSESGFLGYNSYIRMTQFSVILSVFEL